MGWGRDLPARGKAAKRKREEEKQRKDKINNGISKYFNSGAAAAAPKPKVSERASSPLDWRGRFGFVEHWLIICALAASCYR